VVCALILLDGNSYHDALTILEGQSVTALTSLSIVFKLQMMLFRTVVLYSTLSHACSASSVM
jgi:hypothetical protein